MTRRGQFITFEGTEGLVSPLNWRTPQVRWTRLALNAL